MNRNLLINDIADKLLQSPVDPTIQGVTVTLTGSGGFGKTTAAKLLCHHCKVKEQFSDGFVFIELGPQPDDSSIKLRGIYNLLTDEQCDISVVEPKIRHLTREHYHNLLVIIDDVWQHEDAEPLVKAFSNCKIILTTRMNDIEQYIPSQELIFIGSMERNEAISLLTSGIAGNSKPLEESLTLLDELAQDVYLWPLILSLIRGQLFHYVKKVSVSFPEAIQNVKDTLRKKGLTAFDRKGSQVTNRKDPQVTEKFDRKDPQVIKRRNLAVKVCMEFTLSLLEKSVSDRIRMLILHNGIGTSLQRSVLNILWSIPKLEAEETVDVLWAYGLVLFIDTTISFKSTHNTQSCVEVHAVISQYIIESMDYKEVLTLAPLMKQNTILLDNELLRKFQSVCGLDDLSSLTDTDYLKFKLSEIENVYLPLTLKKISSFTIFDPYDVVRIIDAIIVMIYNTYELSETSQCTKNLLELVFQKMLPLIDDCKDIVADAHKLSRKLNQSVQRHLLKKDYGELILTVQEYINNYPLGVVLRKAFPLIEKLKPFCNGDMLFENLYIYTPEYHWISRLTFPAIKLFVKLYNQGHNSLLNGLEDIEKECVYYKSGKLSKDLQSIKSNSHITIQKIAPEYSKD